MALVRCIPLLTDKQMTDELQLKTVYLPLQQLQTALPFQGLALKPGALNPPGQGSKLSGSARLHPFALKCTHSGASSLEPACALTPSLLAI
jgi:hypothetical protein